MGAIKTRELANGNIELEITYGGLEAPFGGVDTSAPPAYIDPKCFAAVDGFIVVDNKLVVASFNSYATSPLWSSTAGVTLIGFGNFYSLNYGTLNYALGYKTSSFSGPPSGVQYTFYMTAWNPADITEVYNDTLVFSLYNTATPATNASVTLQLLTQGTIPGGNGAVASITGIGNVNIGPGPVIETIVGVVTAVSVLGGTGYTVGETLYLVQGNNTTAQVTVSAVDGSGGITAVTINAASYSIPFDGTTYTMAGAFYNVGAVTLLASAPNQNVVLKIVGPGGTNSYTVPVPSSSTGTATTGAGTGAVCVLGVSGGGYLLQLTTTSGGSGYAGGMYYSVAGTHGGTGAIIYVPAVGSGGSLPNSGIFCVNSGTGYINNDSATLTPIAYGTVIITPVDILNYMNQLINGDITGIPADPNVTSSVNVSTGTITLTALVAGTVGNSITVQDLSEIISAPTTFYYYFPCRTPVHLSGGTNSSTSGGLPTILNPHASITSAGGYLYIGNIGPMIIKYGGPTLFAISSVYEGVRVLRKFAGSLIGLGLIPAPGTVVQATDMIFLWSAPEDLDTWNPTNAIGNVTGAGFEQLADIGEYLTGLIVTGGTAYIIRARGISYATATGNGTLPFSVNHIGLGPEGEGAQLTDLVCQYDQTGAFVGNSDVFQLSGSISSIGAKIKQLLFNTILDAEEFPFYSSNTCSVFLVDEVPIIFFLINNILFGFNASNGTWGIYTLDVSPDGLEYAALGVFASENSFAEANEYSQAQLIFAFNMGYGYNFFNLNEGVPNIESLSNPPTVSFPVEEVSFGRDITVDSLYISLWGNVTENVTITFLINIMQNVADPGEPAVYKVVSLTYATLVLTPAQFNTLEGAPIELQLYSTNQGAGAVTGHSPQLEIEVSSITDEGTAEIRFSKIQMYCSFDPTQRPV